MYAALCFDLDGTLARFAGDFDELLDGLRTELGLLACDFTTFRRQVATELRREGPLTLRSALRTALEGLELRVPDDLGRVVERTVLDYANAMTLRDGAEALLTRLHRLRVPLALISNGPDDMQRAALAALGIERYFTVVLISGDPDVAVRKPCPRIFDLACSGLATLPADTVMIGDDLENDIAGALAFGMPAILVSESGDERAGAGAQTVTDLSALDVVLKARLKARTA